jgi:hypothetical protein
VLGLRFGLFFVVIWKRAHSGIHMFNGLN